MGNLSSSSYGEDFIALTIIHLHTITRTQPDIISVFQEFLRDHSFPCVGAKSALARGQIAYCVAEDLRTATGDLRITRELQRFARQCSPDSLFVSFAVLFPDTPPMSEAEFESSLWERLQAVHDEDAQSYGWDAEVSSDPEAADFSMSVGGKAFYVVGLHPRSSRPARRFSCPALVFNLHSQFGLLKDQGSYAQIRQTILDRDERLSGSLNPMLAAHGQSSAARQYSGRESAAEWKCPFHARPKQRA